MSAEITLGTPVADALNTAIQNKIAELGWASNSSEGAAMSEYFCLMLVNGKTADEIASEISSDLLSLGPEDQTPRIFANWVIEESHRLSGSAGNNQSAPATSQDEAMDGGFDAGADSMTDAPATELHAYVSTPHVVFVSKANFLQPYWPKGDARWSGGHARRPRQAHDGSN